MLKQREASICGFPFFALAKCLQFLVAVRILNDEIN